MCSLNLPKLLDYTMIPNIGYEENYRAQKILFHSSQLISFLCLTLSSCLELTLMVDFFLLIRNPFSDPHKRVFIISVICILFSHPLLVLRVVVCLIMDMDWDSSDAIPLTGVSIVYFWLVATLLCVIVFSWYRL